MFIFLKFGIGQGYIYILCGVDVCVNVYGSMVIYIYIFVIEIYKFISNVFRKFLGFIFLFVKRRGLSQLDVMFFVSLIFYEFVYLVNFICI